MCWVVHKTRPCLEKPTCGLNGHLRLSCPLCMGPHRRRGQHVVLPSNCRRVAAAATNRPAAAASLPPLTRYRTTRQPSTSASTTTPAARPRILPSLPQSFRGATIKQRLRQGKEGASSRHRRRAGSIAPVPATIAALRHLLCRAGPRRVTGSRPHAPRCVATALFWSQPCWS